MSVADPSRVPRRVPAATAPNPPAQVRAGWLLGALGLLVLAALCCAYLSLCLLFAQGQWQILYRPSPAITATPASRGIDFTAVRIKLADAGGGELSGWWLPAAPASPLAGTTVLYLHNGAGNLSDTLPDLTHLHELGCAVFAIDYRGYGASARQNPSEAHMIDDAAHALIYLTGTRHVAAGSIVIWGRGIGATIAAESADASPDAHLLRLVLEEVNLPALDLLRDDARTRLIPVRLLLHDRLDAAPSMARSSVPKLFLGADAGTTRLYALASGPKERIRADDATALAGFLSGAHQSHP